MIKKFALSILFCSILFAYSGSFLSFNTGQVSPYMESRVDYAKYGSCCRLLENMFVFTEGSAIRRSGTAYIATAKTDDPVLISFEYSVEDTYILECGNEYIRFYRNGGQILDGNDPYEIETVFDTNELRNIRYIQSSSTMYIVDGNDQPQKLTRSAHTSWTIEDVNITTGPFMPMSTADINIVPSDTDIGETITLTADSNIFYTGHEGALWKLTQDRSTSTLTGELDANEVSLSSPYFSGGYNFTTSGTWEATVVLQRSTNGGLTWEAALTPMDLNNFDNPAETEEDGAIYRVAMTDYVSGTCTFTLIMGDSTQIGIVKIVSVVDGNEATAIVLSELASTSATKNWAEGYWSDYRGWPRTVCSHQQRLVFGGSLSFPQTIWFGKANPDDSLNFTEGTLDTSAFTVTIPGQNPIQWLLSGDYLFMGTSGSCGRYGEQNKAITPTSPSYSEQTKNGSANVNAIFAADSILYVERGASNVREFTYSLQVDKHVSNNLNVLSSDITKSGIKTASYQNKPRPMLWCVLNDGNMATLTFQKDQEVIAWSLQTTSGYFKDVAVIPTNEDEDEVWVVVERDSGQYIEQFKSMDWGEDVNDCWFVDSGLDYSGTATDTFAGLSHLDGETVSIYADGIVCPDVVVSSNSVAITNSASNVIIGLSYTSKLETVPIFLDLQDRAMNKKITALDIDFYKTGYCEYGFGRNSKLTPIHFFDLDTPFTSRQPLYTSDFDFKTVSFPYGHRKKATIYLENSKPVPMTVRSIAVNVEMTR